MNNEERILEMLAAMRSEMDARFTRLEATQTKQGEQLTKQGEQLTKQGEQLTKQGEQLAELKEDVSELRETAVRVAITQENIILPRLDTLADGHKHLLDTLASKSRVEALEDDVSTLKSVVKSMSSRLSALEKAQ